MASRMGIVTLALVRDTFREAFARKIFWGFFGCSTAVILFFIFLMKIDVVEGALATVSLFGKEMRAQEVTNIVRGVQGALAAFLYGFGLFLAVFASAGLIPTIFEPGRIELLLSKPVRRYHILLGRYLGNLLVIAFNMMYLVLSVWIILGIKTEIWTHQFLYSAGLTIFVFAILLTIVVLIGVLSESAVLSTMVTFGVMIAGLIVAQKSTIERLLTSEWSRDVVRVLYYALPKVWDLGNIGRKLVTGVPIEDWMPVWSSALFGVVVLGTGLLVFSRRNY
ncbi:MAG TPA: ABC transporter permease subunit [Bryobacteraceae bacterium]|jgi:ABC-type transport system involved in multi-copper enzyme maturation permease subunit|nr:ABC transporter permease subunit [Bryobacteraceae bacterium]